MDERSFDELTPLEQVIATCRNPERKQKAAAELANNNKTIGKLVHAAVLL